MDIVTLIVCVIIAVFFLIQMCFLWRFRSVLEEDLKKNGGYKLYQSTIDDTDKTDANAFDYVTIEEVARIKKVNLRLQKATPNLLVGLGIAGTFLGLSLGINDLPHEWSAESIGEVQNFLDAMGTAFWSSLCGMGFSIVFIFVQRLIMNCCSKKIEDFCNKENELHYVSQAEMLAKHYGVSTGEAISRVVAEKIEVLIGRVSETLDEKLSQTANALALAASSLEQGTLSLNTTIESGKKLIDDGVKGIKEASGAMSHAISETTSVLEQSTKLFSDELARGGSKLESANEALQTSADKLQGVATSVSTVSKGLTTSVDCLSKELDNTLPTVVDLIDDLKEATGSFVEGTQGLKTTVTDDLAGVVSEFKQTVESEKQSIEAIKESSTALRGASEEFTKGVKDMQPMFSEMKKVAETFSKVNDTFENVTSEFKEVLDEFNKAMRKYTPTIDNTAMLLRSWGTTINEITPKMDEIAENLKIENGVVGKLVDVVDRLMREFSVERLEPMFDKMVETSRRLDGVNNAIEETTETFKGVANDFAISMHNCTSALNSMLGDLKKISPEFSKMAENLQQEVNTLAEMRSLVAELKQAIEGVQNLPDSVDKLDKGMEKVINSVIEQVNVLLVKFSEEFTKSCQVIDNTTSNLNAVLESFNLKSETIINKFPQIDKVSLEQLKQMNQLLSEISKQNNKKTELVDEKKE